MNLFEQTVNAVLANQQTYTALRPVLEKEILHHDILRILSRAGVLQKLTFMGGTCLRACYGFVRLSEDLDFTGGFNFKKDDLSGIGDLLRKAIWQKYNLRLDVLEPVKEKGNTQTWKVKIITVPEHPHLPQQRINIDICMLPSYESRPAMLRNHYGLETGISYTERLTQHKTQQKEFLREMQRFLSPEVFTNEMTDKLWWENLFYLLKDWGVA